VADLEDFEIDQTDRLISTESFSLGVKKIIVVSFEGVEALSSMSKFTLEIVTKGRALKPSEVLAQKLTIALRYRGDVRTFSGIIVRFEVLRSAYRGHHLHVIDLAPPAWLLTLNRNCKIFHDVASHDAIGQVLSAGSITCAPKSVGATREYWVQYCESDFDFVSRLLEEEGLFYRFDHSDANCGMIIGDGSNDYVRAEPEVIELFDRLESWQPQYAIGPSAFKHTAWDYKAVSLMDGSVTGLDKAQPPGLSPRAVYEYPGRHETVDEADRLARTRMEERESEVVWIPATSDNCLVEPARKFKIKDRSIDLPSGGAESDSYVVVRVEHRAQDYTEMPFDGDTRYGNAFECIPADFDFRPPRRTPRPYIRGPQTATVTDTPDDLGRAKVKFHWDDSDDSRWVRVAQVWAYNSMGSQYFPRVGSEVVVEFLDGDPDHPIIVGMVYNGKNKPPFGVPDNKTQSGIRGANWGSDGVADTSNELRFEDKSGSEEIYVHAQKDFRRVVVNDDKLTVEQGDRTLEIQQGNVKETVDQGNHTTTISMGNHATEVSMGNHSVKVDVGKSSVDAMQSITLTVGGNSVTIDQTGVTIKGLMISIEGQTTTDVKGLMTTVNGDAMLTLKGGITMIN
jgi:type VI secretion system secreted protein VgrG